MQKIVICGSLRFKKEILAFAKKLRKLGLKYVIDPGFENITEEISAIHDEKERMRQHPFYKKQLPELVMNYVNKIRKADIVYFYNKNQIMGINTTLELGIAIGLEKIIIFHEKDINEPCRQCFCDFVISTPEELAKFY